jgi:glycosyltransferase involved in cell wall biosynthesis
MGCVQADPVEPGGEQSAAAKARQPEPGAEEAFLGRVGSVLGGAERASRQRVDALLVPLHELLERPAVASLRPLDELCVRIPHALKILLWHGYLLGGTGSNVYTRSLARAWSRAGHDVVVFAQEPHPEQFDLGGATVVRPALDGPLPVFVLDRYEDLEARYLQDLSAAERESFVERNAAAVREHLPADYLVVNHVLLGAPVGAAVGMPFVVKAHGSELEFSMRGNDDLVAWARETLAGAKEIVVGSEHVRNVLADVVGWTERVRIVPPGVDIEEFKPRLREDALRLLLEEAGRDAPSTSERHPDAGNAERLEAFFADERPTVAYVGKLSREKGVHLLLEALREVDAKAVVTGFGPAREELERAAGPGVVFTGPLEHRHLAQLWPLADVSVTPSVFPEAFGMVAVEAAACGSPPLVALHSGLAAVAAGLESEYPAEHRHLVSFTPNDSGDLAAKLAEILALRPEEWRALSEAARRAAVRLWSWEHVAQLVLSPE